MSRNFCHQNNLQLVVEARPDPLKKGRGLHTATLENYSNINHYDVDLATSTSPGAARWVGLGLPPLGTSSYSAGTVATGKSAKARVSITRHTVPDQPVEERFVTTVTWTLVASQPQAPQAPAPVYGLPPCDCTVGIR